MFSTQDNLHLMLLTLKIDIFSKAMVLHILYIKANMVSVISVSVFDDWITFLDDNGEGGSYSLFAFLLLFFPFFLYLCSSIRQSFRPSVLPSNHCSFPAGLTWEGPTRTRKNRAREDQHGQGGTRWGRTEWGKLDKCIMYRVHTSFSKENVVTLKCQNS